MSLNSFRSFSSCFTTFGAGTSFNWVLFFSIARDKTPCNTSICLLFSFIFLVVFFNSNSITKINIISNKDFPIDDREAMIRQGYRKNENIVYKYETVIDEGPISVTTDLTAGTHVLVEVSLVTLEDMAVEIGAHKAVIDSLREVMPDKMDEIVGNEDAMKALENFAAGFGGRGSLKEHRSRIPTTILPGGKLEVSDIEGGVKGHKVELIATLI